MGEIVMATNFAWAAVYRLYDSGRVDIVDGEIKTVGYVAEGRWSPRNYSRNEVMEYIDNTSGSYAITLGATVLITGTGYNVEAVEAMATAMLDGSNRVYDIEEKKYITWS